LPEILTIPKPACPKGVEMAATVPSKLEV